MNDKFRPQPSSGKGMENKELEYSFDKGVAEATSRIKKLFKTLNRHVYVTIYGSGQNVGKTNLLSALQIQLSLLRIPTEHEWTEGHDTPKTKTVRFNTEVGNLWTTGAKLREFALQNNPNLKFGDSQMLADFYIGIYRPDKKFLESPKIPEVADMVICNEYAMDKQKQ